MTITKKQALHADEFHYGECTRVTGPRNGVKETVYRWSRNGLTQVWKTRPEDFRVPVKHGLREYAQITPDNAHLFHTAEDCPLVLGRMRRLDVDITEVKRGDIIVGCEEDGPVRSHRPQVGYEKTQELVVWEDGTRDYWGKPQRVEVYRP